jgi:hypothetical protein
MKLEDIRTVARSHGIEPNQLSKTELIKRSKPMKATSPVSLAPIAAKSYQEGCLKREGRLAVHL